MDAQGVDGIASIHHEDQVRRSVSIGGVRVIESGPLIGGVRVMSLAH